MRKFNTAIIGAAAAALLFATPVSATPLAGATSNIASQAVTQSNGTANVIQIQSRTKKRARRADRRRLRGHRGVRDRRRGYRRHSDGWWYPLAAFGAIAAGSAIANSADRGDRHEEWCEDRYRSYRVWDNTFQPYNGPRKECISPYS